MAFPDDDMLGIDIVIADITYLHKISDRIRGIVLTHGHEDHIGAIPYVLKEFNVPVYGTRLTLGILKNKLKEHGILNKSTLITINEMCIRDSPKSISFFIISAAGFFILSASSPTVISLGIST